jgi:hypothetical protein
MDDYAKTFELGGKNSKSRKPYDTGGPASQPASQPASSCHDWHHAASKQAAVMTGTTQPASKQLSCLAPATQPASSCHDWHQPANQQAAVMTGTTQPASKQLS